jgi:hypothetical protein
MCESKTIFWDAHEAFLNHHGNTLIHLSNLLKYTVEVGVDPVSALGSQTSSRSETSKVVRSFIDGCNRESVNVTTILDEVEYTIDSLERVVKVCGVLEPVLVEECLANVKVVHTTGKRMETEDD